MNKLVKNGAIGIIIGALLLIILENSKSVPALVFATLLMCVFTPIFLEGISNNEKRNIFLLVTLWIMVYIIIMIKQDNLMQNLITASIFVIVTFASQAFAYNIKTKKITKFIQRLKN